MTGFTYSSQRYNILIISLQNYNSIKISKDFIKKAEANMKINLYDVAFLMAYNSMFQSVRAFLFSEGITERSHYCAIKYVIENIKEDEIQTILEALDNYRISRHRIQYDGKDTEKNDSKEAIKDARRLASFIGKKISPPKKPQENTL